MINRIPIRIKEALFFAGLYFAMVARYFTRGFHYYTYTDDNNQYGVYFRRALEGDIWQDIVLYYHRFFERPLAFFSDVYLFRPFFPGMQWLLLLITTLYFLMCLLLYQTFRRLSLGFGSVAVLFLALLPCAYEGAYWISASSRIVVSMFLGALSVWLYFGRSQKPDQTRLNRARTIALSTLASLASMLFYEQTALFSCALFFVCALARAADGEPATRAAKIKTALLPLIVPTVNLTLTACYYLYFMFFSPQGLSETRNKFITEGLLQKITETTSALFVLTKETLIDFNAAAIGQAFKSPLTALTGLCLAVLALFAVFVALTPRGEMPGFGKHKIKLAAGLFLTAAPLSIFYLLKNVYYEPRMLFPSFVGFALLLDGVFDAVAAIAAPAQVLKRLCAAAAIIPFFLASVSVTGVYRDTYETDRRIAAQFLSAYTAARTAETTRVYLLNAAVSYTGHKTPPLANITAADWVMLGNLNANQTDYYFRNLVLVRDGGAFDAAVFRDPAALVLWIAADQTVTPLSLDDAGNLTLATGAAVGTVADGVLHAAAG